MSEPAQVESGETTTLPKGSISDEEALALVDAAAKEAEAKEEQTAEEEPAQQEEAEEATSEPEDSEAEDAADEPTDEGKKSIAAAWEKITAAEARTRRERDAIKRERQELSSLKEELEKGRTSNASLLDELKSNPFGVLEKAGVSFESLANAVIEGKDTVQPTQKPQQSSEVASLKEEIKAMRDMMERQTYQSREQQIRDEIAVELGREENALINTYPGAAAEVWTAMTEHYQQTQQYLPPKDAVAKLQTIWKDHLKGMSSHAAVREALGLSPSPESDKPTEPEPAKGKVKAKTLTNKGAAPARKGKTETRKLSEDELMEQAMNLLPGDEELWPE